MAVSVTERENSKGNILLVEDGPSYINMFKQALNSDFPDFNIMQTDNLEDARKLLRENDFAAAIIDNGFLDKPEGTRIGSAGSEAGAGVMLIKDIRKGDHELNGGVGRHNKHIPIAFNSAEFIETKGNAAQRVNQNAGPLASFEKGVSYFGKKSDTSLRAVTGETMKWLTEQLEEELLLDIQARQAKVHENIRLSSRSLTQVLKDMLGLGGNEQKP